MAKNGIKGIIGGGSAPGVAADKVIDAWHQVQATHGREMARGVDLIIGFSYHIADTEEKRQSRRLRVCLRVAWGYRTVDLSVIKFL